MGTCTCAAPKDNKTHARPPPTIANTLSFETTLPKDLDTFKDHPNTSGTTRDSHKMFSRQNDAPHFTQKQEVCMAQTPQMRLFSQVLHSILQKSSQASEQARGVSRSSRHRQSILRINPQNAELSRINEVSEQTSNNTHKSNPKIGSTASDNGTKTKGKAGNVVRFQEEQHLYVRDYQYVGQVIQTMSTLKQERGDFQREEQTD